MNSEKNILTALRGRKEYVPLHRKQVGALAGKDRRGSTPPPHHTYNNQQQNNTHCRMTINETQDEIIEEFVELEDWMDR